MTRPTVTDLDPAVRDALVRAVREFNSWRFYDCHETLEDVWRESGGKMLTRRPEDEPGLADFYQGIIKAAAGFHHLLRGNYKGVVNLLSDSLRLLRPYQPATLGVDVSALLAGVRRSLERIVDLGPERLSEFDRSTIPSIDLERQGERQA